MYHYCYGLCTAIGRGMNVWVAVWTTNLRFRWHKLHLHFTVSYKLQPTKPGRIIHSLGNNIEKGSPCTIDGKENPGPK